ncbi:MAG: ABC transporter permease [Persicimonas sp.]
MKLSSTVREASRTLLANKLRTFLMTVGTSIGIAALVVIMAVGNGTEEKVTERVEGFGSRAIMLIAGGGKDKPPPDTNVTTLRLEDAEAIRDEISGIEIATPAAFERKVSLKATGSQTRATVFAVESDWHRAWDWHVSRGEPISASDVSAKRRTCVIGETVKEELFGEGAAIGEFIQLDKSRCQVSGVLDARGTSPMGTDFDNRVLVPLTTGMRRIFNQDHITYVRIKVKPDTDTAAVAERVRRVMRKQHRIGADREDDFRLITPEVIAGLVRGMAGKLSWLLGIVAALSLLIGGVVVMNIMLMSVDERTSAIGVRRAVGASRADIRNQFLVESLFVAFLGSATGGLLGAAGCLLLGQLSPLPVVLSWQPFALAVVVALVVGVGFGVYPATKAASLDPVDALR